jgi:hypothetical protein
MVPMKVKKRMIEMPNDVFRGFFAKGSAADGQA